MMEENKTQQPQEEVVIEEKMTSDDVLAKEENLSDDELYAKIQTHKLLAKKKKRKIFSLSLLVFAFLLATTILILGTVPFSLKPNCIQTNDSYSVMLFPGNLNGEAPTDEKEFDKLFDAAFAQTYLGAMFNGSLFDYQITEELKSADVYVGAGGTLVQADTYFARIRFDEERIFTYQNGAQFQSKYENSRWQDDKLTFTEVYVTISQEEGLTETKIYIPVQYPDSEGVANQIDGVITVTVSANTYQIFDAWESLV